MSRHLLVNTDGPQNFRHLLKTVDYLRPGIHQNTGLMIAPAMKTAVFIMEVPKLALFF